MTCKDMIHCAGQELFTLLWFGKDVALHDITAIREGSASFLLDRSFLGHWSFGQS
jgi:hypothetical protein